METENNSSCVLCGSIDADLILVGRDLAFNLPGEFPLVRCKSCGLVYLRDRPTHRTIERYYPPEYLPYREAIQDERSALMRWARLRNLRQRTQVVMANSPRNPGRILDVGCSTGIFLDGMRESGWDPLGVEINSRAARYARERFDLEVIPGQLEDVATPPASFDAITLWDVLEHTFNPLQTLHQVHHLMVPDGVLVMTLPNWESLDRRLFGRSWIGYDIPRHLYSFPRPVLKRMLEETGFVLEKAWCGLSGYYTFVASVRLWASTGVRHPTLRSALLVGLNLPGMRFLVQPVFTLLDRIGLGGSLVIVARKAPD